MEDEIVKFYLRLNAISEEIKSLSRELEKMNLDFIEKIITEYICAISNVDFD